jgi:methionyl aminopeptidase
MNENEILNNYKKAGQIAYAVKEYAKSIIKKDMLLYEITEKMESKIIELGGKLAFPTTICIDEIAAHKTPLFEDKETARGLLKVDFGVHINGYISDCAFSIDLENNKENKEIINASETALKNSLKSINQNTRLRDIGNKIQKNITNFNLNPIKNLSGHSLEQFEIHSGITIPNYDNGIESKLERGFYAIEPFATKGEGRVYEGGNSRIYLLQNIRPVRDSFSREVFSYIQEEYHTLPFCSRWLIKKFGKKVLITLNLLEKQKIIKQYAQLIEASKEKVSQSETTIYFDGEKAIDLINRN